MGLFTLTIRFLAVLALVGLSSSKLEIQSKLIEKRKESWPPSQVLTPRSEEGVWGPWGLWAPCSRTCGGGVAVQTRQCLPNNSTDTRTRSGRRRRKLSSANEVLEPSHHSLKGRPDHGHKSHTIVSSNGVSWRCAGQDKRYHECNTLSCPGPFKDFRAEQCSVYNKRPFRGRYFVWQPYIDEKNPCLLNCRPMGRAFYATLAQAIDGTICDKPGYRAICVQGQCKAVGLNGVVSAWNPSPPSQGCGARLVSGLFTRSQMPLGYTLLTTIPQGACRINVTEMHHSNNYLALKITNGTFVINGNFAISWSGEYEAAGTKFFYRRQSGTMVEALSAPGPLTQSVDVMILYQHPNPGIKYEYTIRIPEDEDNPVAPSKPVIAPVLLHSLSNISSPRHHTPTIHRQHKPRSDLDENSNTIPKASSDSIPSREAHDDENAIDHRKQEQDKFPYGPGVLATESEKPHQSHVSPRHRRRRFVWQIVKYTQCSKPCAGIQTPVFACVRDVGQVPVPERRCGARPNAAGLRSCGGPCAPRWAPLPWGPCSGPCGTQTRVVQCRQDVAHSALNVKVSDVLCLDKPMAVVQKCQQSECANAEAEGQLNTNEISPSNRQHDPANRHYDPANRQYDPANRQYDPVNRQHDPDARQYDSDVHQYDSEFNQYDQNNRRYDQTNQHHDRDLPNRHDTNRQPEVTLFRGQDPVIRTGSRSRNFRDKDDVDRFTDGSGTVITRFTNNTKPKPNDGRDKHDELSNEVSGKANGGHWKADNAWIYSEWTQECSEECGRGVQTRMVRCADPSGCDEKKKPVDSRACSSDRKCVTQSFKWFTGPWSPCSDPCAINGKMSREVVCLVYNRGQHRVGTGCPVRERPEPERPCPPNLLRADCQAQWFVSDWSQCAGVCGSTKQERLVTCQGSAGAPGAACPGLRPSASRECVPSHCHLGGFTPAPKTERDKENENSLDDTPQSGECIDKISGCHLAVQARLCPYKYYANSCCAACRRALSLS